MTRFIVSIALVLVFGSSAHAQTSSQIFGRATDTSGAVLQGVTVTLSGGALLQPIVAITSATGSYQFPGLGIGVYAVTFELSGFRTLVREQIQLQVGFNAQINAQLAIASVEESLTVTAASPVVDTRSTAQGLVLNLEALQAVPTARDQFHLLEQAPGVMVDRQNVGGTTTSNQTNFIARGTPFQQLQWFVDGVDIASTGNGAPYYMNYEAFEEVQISTGANDVAFQTPGAAINIVAKRGSDQFRGAAGAYFTDQKFASENMTDTLRRQGATAGSPVHYVRDFNVDAGGPIRAGRAWYWGAVRDVRRQVGVNGVYNRARSECLPISANPLAYALKEVQDCLYPDRATSQHINYRITTQPFKGNQLSVYNSYDMKQEAVRGGDDLNPIESTQKGTSLWDTQYGPRFWRTGWPVTWKFSDQQMFSDRWMAEFAVMHFGKILHHQRQDPALRDVQRATEISTGLNGRAPMSQNANITLFDAIDMTTNYFVPGQWGGDHSIKAGYRFSEYEDFTHQDHGTGVTARFSSGNQAPFTVPFSAMFSQGQRRAQFLYKHSAYIQDSYSFKRVALNLGLRWDRQDDAQARSTMTPNPFQGQVTMNGIVFNYLPERTFPGATGGVIWNVFAPRLGMTYDMFGDGKTVLKAFYGQYYDQRPTGQMSGTYNTVGNITVEFPWNDLNRDAFVQANEVDTSRILSFGGQYNPANPGQQAQSPNLVDPNVSNPLTHEIVVGLSRELAPNLGLSASYIWRHFGNFTWQQRVGLSSANYSPVTFTPAASACPSASRCEAITYWVPNIPVPAEYVFTNQPDAHKRYHGIEAVMTKRMSNRWMMNASLSFNHTPVFYTSPTAYEDPTNIAQQNGGQFVQESTAAGLSNVFPNAKWLARLSGAYRLPWRDIGVSGSFDARQGYPFMPTINITSRPNRGGAVQVLLDSPGDVRLSTFQTLDLRVDKRFTLRGLSLQPALDIFNLMNGNTVLAKRRIQNASNANNVNDILPPRIVRFGLRVTF